MKYVKCTYLNNEFEKIRKYFTSVLCKQRVFFLFNFFAADDFIPYELRSQHETKTDPNYIICTAGLIVHVILNKTFSVNFHQNVITRSTWANTS